MSVSVYMVLLGSIHCDENVFRSVFELMLCNPIVAQVSTLKKERK